MPLSYRGGITAAIMESMAKLLMVLSLILAFGSTACIIRTKPRHGHHSHAVKHKKHKHEHCHKKSNKKRDHRKVCHSHKHKRSHH